MPIDRDALKRDVAVQAERSWWIKKLREMAEDWRDAASNPPHLPDVDNMVRLLASHVDILIAERER